MCLFILFFAVSRDLRIAFDFFGVGWPVEIVTIPEVRVSALSSVFVFVSVCCLSVCPCFHFDFVRLFLIRFHIYSSQKRSESLSEQLPLPLLRCRWPTMSARSRLHVHLQQLRQIDSD